MAARLAASEAENTALKNRVDLLELGITNTPTSVPGSRSILDTIISLACYTEGEAPVGYSCPTSQYGDSMVISDYFGLRLLKYTSHISGFLHINGVVAGFDLSEYTQHLEVCALTI